MKKLLCTFVLALGCIPLLAAAGEPPVSENKNHQAMLQSQDPKLAANKKVVYDFWRDVVEAGHMELMSKYTTDGYIQHNPNVASGSKALADYFVKSGKKPTPIPARMQSPLVALIAEGDLVMISFVRTLEDPKDKTKKYTTTGLTLFRIENGKIAEHWDPGLKDS